MDSMIQGLSVAFQPLNLLYCFLGVFIGTMIGVLPGLGPAATISLLLPVSFGMPPVAAIIMLAGIYYGAQYGGSTTSILVNIPGEAASVMTCLDGYQMARQGRAGPALGISAFGSFLGGTAGVVGLMFLAPILAEMALRFGPPEYFSLVLLGLVLVSYLGSESRIKSLIIAGFGLFLGAIGTDIITGQPKFTLGMITLMDGIGLVPCVMGLFGISEVLLNLEESISREIYQRRVRNLLPNKQDWQQSLKPMVRGTVLGFLVGIIPGGGAAIASFISYGLEKRLSKHPHKFGSGAIEGVAGPETANNSATAGAFIPLLSLGIPSNVVMALILGALLIHGIQVGPLLLKDHPQMFWGVISSMYVGNLLLLVLNLPLIGLWIQIIRIPYLYLFPAILLLCLVGTYTLSFNPVEIYLTLFFGLLGYAMKKIKFEAAPLVLALVLSPLLENSLRQSLLLSRGSFQIFITRPISLFFLIAAVLLFLSSLVRKKTVPLAQEART